MRGLFLVIIFLFLSFNISSQNRLTDSLYSILRISKNDSNKVKLLNEIGWEVSYFNLDSGLNYGLQGLKLANEIKYYKSNCDLCNTIAAIYSDQGNYKETVNYLQKALDYCLRYPNVFMEAEIYNTYANMYQRKNEFKKSIEYYYKSINCYKQANIEKSVYTMYGNLAGVFQKADVLDSALFYIQKSIEYHLKNNKQKKLAYNYVNASEIYYYLEDYVKAEKYATLAINLARSIEDNYLLIHALIHKGHVLNYSKKFTESIPVLKEGLEIAKQSGEIEVMKTGSKYLSEAYVGVNDYKSALEFQNDFQYYKDSMFNSDNNKIIKELETKYEVEKKQKEISELNEKNRVQQLASEKNRVLLYASIGGVIALLIIAFVLQNRNALKQKVNAKLEIVNREIHLQKELVEEKNKEITDSINYAKRIQQNILTSDSYFKKHTSDFFILFKPKDIVSGDFYWALNHDDKFILMTADCTGHGVPGAMMSMMGINFLNEIVNEKKITKPAEILNQMRGDIIKALNPEGSLEETKDGMDCSLCSFDFNTMKLTYANANNSFYIIRNGELLISKTNKMPVGAGHNANILFTEFEIDIRKDDLVITFTDGYADQFGGPKGKKFKYKQLEELLFSSSHLPLNSIKDKLNETIELWKGNLEQVDDICVIGIKV